MKKVTILLTMLANMSYSQTFKDGDINIVTKEGITSIYFVNGNSEGFYLDGLFLKSYGVLKFPATYFSSFYEDLNYASKRSTVTIERDKYRVEKYSFSKDEVFFTVKDKVGTITKDQIRKLKDL
jgi:hypothetical protein